MKAKKVLGLLSFVFLLTACNTNFNSVIPGKWKCIDYSAHFKDISPNIIAMAKKVALATTYTFSEDHTFIKEYDNETQIGEWKYEAKTKELYLRYADKKKSTYIIERFSNNEVRLKNDVFDGEYEIILLRKE